MSKTTVLFLCSDNALLGPLAEACLNQKGSGLLRAFSAGVSPSDDLDCNVTRLLTAKDLHAEGLAPKSFEVFTMPHAPMPDRMIILDGCELPELPKTWLGQVPINFWNIAAGTQYPRSFSAASEYFRRVRLSVDRVLEPMMDDPPATKVA